MKDDNMQTDNLNRRERRFLPVRGNARRSALGIWTLIMSLLQPGSPFAVFWFVVTVIVDAFNGKPWRVGSHIGKEICKRFPTFANSNSTTPIIGIIGMIGIVASAAHIFPYTVYGSSFHAVNCSSLLQKIIFQATTRLSSIVSKIRSLDYPDISTIALAKILSMISFIIFGTLEDCKARESLTSKINKPHNVYCTNQWDVMSNAGRRAS